MTIQPTLPPPACIDIRAYKGAAVVTNIRYMTEQRDGAGGKMATIPVPAAVLDDEAPGHDIGH